MQHPTQDIIPSLTHHLLGATASLYTMRLLLVPLTTEGSGHTQMHLLSSYSAWKQCLQTLELPNYHASQI